MRFLRTSKYDNFESGKHAKWRYGINWMSIIDVSTVVHLNSDSSKLIFSGICPYYYFSTAVVIIRRLCRVWNLFARLGRNSLRLIYGVKQYIRYFVGFSFRFRTCFTCISNGKLLTSTWHRISFWFSNGFTNLLLSCRLLFLTVFVSTLFS